MTGHNDQGVTALQPRKRFPEFDGTGNWVERKIGDFLTESREKGSKGDVAKKLTVKLWGKGVFEKEEALTGSANTQYYRRSAGQFIYSKLDFLNQAFGVIPEALDGFESTIDLPCFDIKPGMNPTFLLEYVQRESFYKKNGEVADGGRKAKRIQPEVFFEMPIITPPRLEEQDAIAEATLSIDSLIEAETEKLDALKDHKQGLMQQLFPAEGESLPALRFPKFSELDAWDTCSLDDLCAMRAGQFIRASEIQDVPADDLYPCYGGNGLRGYVETYTHEGRFPLVGRQGALCGNVKLAEGQFHATEHAIVATPKRSVDVDWLFYLLDFMQLNKHATGQAQPGLSVGALEQLPAWKPCEREQTQIASALSAADELIASQEAKVCSLQSHKLGLLQQLFPVLDEVDG